MRYESYALRPEFKNAPTTFGGFGIVRQRRGDGTWGIIIKQRNGMGSSPFLFDLPGGRKEADDPSLAHTAAREVLEEIGVSSCPDQSIAIASPLWLPIYRDGKLERVDCAVAFLVDIGAEEPQLSAEAISIAVVDERSIVGFNVVGLKFGADPSSRAFGRTAVMIWDGLSVSKPPFYRCENPTDEQLRQLEKRFGTGLSEALLLPVDDGNYLARLNNGAVEIYHRLNPFEERGRFVGNLEDLV